MIFTAFVGCQLDRRAPVCAVACAHARPAPLADAPWNDVTWTIQVFVVCYACYPCIAPLLRKLPLSSMRAWALISYIVYLILALLAFAGLPGKAGWDGGGEPGLAFGASYNVAFVNVPVFVMGCCAGFEASYGTPPPKALTSLYSLGGVTTVASGAATGCVALFIIGIWSVAHLTAGTNPSNPFAHGGGEPTIITFMIMVLVVPLGYDLIIALCRDKDPQAAAPAAGGAGPSSPETAIVPAADENGNPVALPIVPANAGSHAARQCDLQEGWAMAFFRCKPLLWMASIRCAPLSESMNQPGLPARARAPHGTAHAPVLIDWLPVDGNTCITS